MRDALERGERHGDLFDPVLADRQPLGRPLKKSRYARGPRTGSAGLADLVMPGPPPACEADVVAPALARRDEDVPVCGLSESLVRPHDHRVVPVEIAEHAPSGLVGAVQPWAFPAP